VPTIDELSEVVENARRGDNNVEASFHPELGYPTEIHSSPKEQVLDAGIDYRARELRPL